MIDLIYYTRAYPSTGLGHLKRGLDIVACLKEYDNKITVAIAGDLSEAAESFALNHVASGVEIINTKKYDLLCDVAVVDIMFDPFDAEFIDERVCNEIKNHSRFLIMVCGINKVIIPSSVDIFMTHLPLVKVSNRGNARCYSGFEYNPVPCSYRKKESEEMIKGRCLVAIGSNDDQYGPEYFIKRISMVECVNEIDLIVSPLYPKDKKDGLMNKFKHVNVYQNVESLKPFIEKSEIIVTTYGHSAFESMFLIRPTYLVNYKKFQYDYSMFLQKIGVAVNLGYFDEDLSEALSVLADEERRVALSERCRQIVSDVGINNISKIILKEIAYV